MNLDAMFKAFLAQMGAKRDAGERPLERSFGISVKDIDEKARSVRVIASSEAIDSYGEIVRQNFDLSRYNRNPVVLYGHNQVGVFGMGGAPEWTLPIGFSTDVEVVKNELQSTLNLVDEKANPLAELVWQSVLQGSLRAVSIGFYPHTVLEEVHDDVEVYVLDDNELFEMSLVPMGANPDAVAVNAQRAQERAWMKQRAAGVAGSDWNPRRKAISLPLPAPSPEPKPEAAKAAQENDAMTLTAEQIKKLTDDLATAQTALGQKDTEIVALKEQSASLKTSAESASGRADKADARVKELEAELKTKNDADADAAIDAEVDALVGLKIKAEQKATFVKLRTSSKESFDEIVSGMPDLVDQKALEAEVDSIVGKKITPALKAAYIKLRKLSPELYAEIVKDTPDLPHVKSQTPPDPKPTRNKSDGKLGDSKIVENIAKESSQDDG
jgi:HK97 family phage prohead protease